MPRIAHNTAHANANNNQQQTNLLTRIEENTKNIKLEAETIDINVADLEALQTTANTTLAAILVDTDAADSSLNTIEAQSVLTASRLNNIQNKISANVDGTGDTLGQINSNILAKNTEIETSLNSILSDSSAIKTSVQLLDNAIAGNEMQVDVLTMPTVAVTLSGGATEAKQDDGITHLATIAGDTTSIDSKITACNTGAVTVSGSALPSGASTASLQGGGLPSALSSDNLKVSLKESIAVGVTNTTLTNLNNCIASNELQVDIVSSALPSGAATESSLSSLNGKVTACNTGAVVVSGSALPSGAATQSTLNDAEVHLGNIETSVQLIDDVVGTDGSTGPGKCISIGGTESGGNIQELLVDSAGHLQIDVLSAPSTAVTNTTLTNLNNCIGSNELQVDIVASLPTGSNAIGKLSANSGVDIGDVDVTSLPLTFNSGNKDATCQRVVIADDDVNLSAIKTAVELLDDCIGTDNSTGPAKCISIGATNLLGGAIQEIACDGDGHLQIDVLSSALPSGAAGELSNSVIATKATLATSSEVKELLSGVTVNAGALSSEFDTENYERVRFFGETTASTGTDIIFMGSNTSGGTFYVLGENLRSETISSTHYVYASGTENLPRYIKILNKSGSTNYVFTKLYLQGSGGRLAV